MVVNLPKDDENKQEVTAEGVLSPEFASDTSISSEGLVQVERATKLTKLSKIWIAYFKQVPQERGGNWARNFSNAYMNLAMSEDGWNKNKMIQLTAAAKGAPSVGELVKKPGILSRNLTNRDWKKRAEEEGQTVVE